MHVLIDKFGGYINIPIANLSFIVVVVQRKHWGHCHIKARLMSFKKGLDGHRRSKRSFYSAL